MWCDLDHHKWGCELLASSETSGKRWFWYGRQCHLKATTPSQTRSITTIIFTHRLKPESPERGLRSSPPACTASLVVEVQVVRDLDLDLGSGQGHINIRSTCRTTCRPNHVTVALRSTEIWPFEFRQISILDDVWTLVIAFLDGNSKIGLRHAIVQVPYYGHQPSVLSSTPKWRRR